MKQLLPDRDSKRCGIITAIILISYAAQKLVGYYVTPSKELCLCLAMVNTALLLLTTLLLLQSKNVFYTLMAALIGYKMLPVPIPSMAAFSPDAELLYFIVTRAAVLLFAFIAYKTYKRQEDPKEIRALPIVALMFAVPFFNEISDRLSDFLSFKTGTMLYSFFAMYACYLAASLLILGIAYASGKTSMRFAAYFEYAALSINLIKTVAKAVVVYTDTGHFSKSYLGWLLLYAGLMALFALADRTVRKKNVNI